MKAIWHGKVIAESDDTVLVEGNHYFPAAALNPAYVLPSNQRSTCAWKGEARYYTLFVDGDTNPDAVWYYPEPRPEAAMVKDRVAFWKGVHIED
jgi:uncharacterized protein (DUF427 family)